jgi:UTP--glucose-1-phosphate uridylyltransferase
VQQEGAYQPDAKGEGPMTFKPLRKAVFPVGGLGTRFLPATKALPKEMLPIVDRPLIQYAVDEAIEAGIEQMIFVTGRGKSAIEDHFDIAYELETTMSARGKSLEMLDATRLKPGAVAYVRQQEPMGLGHAVWCARDIVGDEPFAVLLADDFMVGRPGCLKQMVEAYNKVGGNMICAQEVADDQTDKYGVITPGTRDGRLTEVKGLVEKPKAGTAPSNLAVIGRYILQPEVMRVLESQEAGAGGEIQLTDAMARMIGDQPFHGVTFKGVRYDCGDKAGFIQANIAIALEREDIGAAVREFAKERLG